MSKTRVYQIAKEFGIPSKELVDALNAVGIEVGSHMSSLDPEVARQIRMMLSSQLKPEPAKEVEKKAAASSEKPVDKAKTKTDTEKAKVEREMAKPEKEKVKPEREKAKPEKERSKTKPIIDEEELPTEKPSRAKPVKPSVKDKDRDEDLDEEKPRKGDKKKRQRGEDNQLESDYTIYRHSESVEEVWEEEVSKDKVKPTRRKGKKRKPRHQEKQDEKPTEIEIPPIITVGELADAMKVPAGNLIAELMNLGIMAAINQTIDPEAAVIIGEEMGIQVTIETEEDVLEDLDIPEDDPASLVERPPIVTVMGHVDHGKTSLLDYIRNTRVIATEAGGITQHIGAYQVEVSGKKITFLDTPGHAAFTEMRSRGAKVTDIVILVVAADDGIMPQTVEAINHSKAAGAPIIVAINKCDLPTANPERVKQGLTQHGLLTEDWGGDTIVVEISAKTGMNIPDLLEAVLSVAELNELKANPDGIARGTVIESNMEKGFGRVATVIVQNGTLHRGESVVVGNYFGRIKTITGDDGKRIREAGPSTPVVISGLDGLPEPGDFLVAYEEEREAKSVAEQRQLKARAHELQRKASTMSLDELVAQMQDDSEQHTLNLIVKADVQGSAEAIKGSLDKLNEKDTRIKFEVIHSGVGAVNETDVMLASASSALVLGFNVNAESMAKQLAETEEVEMKFYTVIYTLLEELEDLGKGMLNPVFEEVNIGTAEVRATFKVPRVGTIAGSYVTQGVIQRNAIVRVYRSGSLVFEGNISSLKRFQNDVREVATGYECGIGIENFNDIKEQDIIEAYIMKEKPQV